MFANRDRTMTRRLVATAVGVFVFVTSVVALAPTSAGAAAKLEPLSLASLCTFPNGEAAFRVTNPNPVDVKFTWEIRNTKLEGKGTASANGDSYLLVDESNEGNTRIFVDGIFQDGSAQRAKQCVMHVKPEKLWLDGEGAQIDSPDVPRKWRLILESELESVFCRWRDGKLLCRSKVDEEDRGEFANVKPVLDVPFKSTFVVTETEIEGVKADGLGKFEVGGQPKGEKELREYFEGGGDTIGVTVTNFLPQDESTTTTVADEDESTTTTVADDDESTTTTVADDDESTTTTVADDDESTTTTVADDDESTTTTVADDDESTTTTVADDDESTTTTVANDQRTQDTVATTLAALDDEESTTTLAPTTTVADTTTSAPTTLAPYSGGDPGGVGDATLRAGEVPDSGVEPASDTLPVTGADSIPLAALGLGLVLAGGLVTVIARRRSPV